MLKKLLACSLLTVGISACAGEPDVVSSSARAVEGDPAPAPTAFRINHMEVRDPHIFSDALFRSDITGVRTAAPGNGFASWRIFKRTIFGFQRFFAVARAQLVCRIAKQAVTQRCEQARFRLCR